MWVLQAVYGLYVILAQVIRVYGLYGLTPEEIEIVEGTYQWINNDPFIMAIKICKEWRG